MIGLDTNIIIRYVMRDDEPQAQAADTLIEGFTAQDPGCISHITLVEVWWVLTRVYKLKDADVAAFLDTLLNTASLALQNPDLVHKALRAVKTNHADFADALIAAVDADAGCTETKTFDTKAAKRAGMTLLNPKAHQ